MHGEGTSVHTSPDYDLAATLAVWVLVDFHATRTPVRPSEIIRHYRNTVLMTYTDVANLGQTTRETFARLIHESDGADAVSCVFNLSHDDHYNIVAYNAKKPLSEIRFQLAKELGRCVMGHIGFRDESVREEEIVHFARHLLYPRPLIRECVDRGMPLTMENLEAISGCSPEAIQRCRKAPDCTIDPVYYDRLREQMRPFVDELILSGKITIER